MWVKFYEFGVKFAVGTGSGGFAYALAVAPIGLGIDAKVSHFKFALSEIIALVAYLRLGLLHSHCFSPFAIATISSKKLMVCIQRRGLQLVGCPSPQSQR